jgi:hypothetical protein
LAAGGPRHRSSVNIETGQLFGDDRGRVVALLDAPINFVPAVLEDGGVPLVNLFLQEFNVFDRVMAGGGFSFPVRGPGQVHDVDQCVNPVQFGEELVA